eukprot:1634527-Pleurochrysis_carterae.AAC.2
MEIHDDDFIEADVELPQRADDTECRARSWPFFQVSGVNDDSTFLAVSCDEPAFILFFGHTGGPKWRGPCSPAVGKCRDTSRPRLSSLPIGEALRQAACRGPCKVSRGP